MESSTFQLLYIKLPYIMNDFAIVLTITLDMCSYNNSSFRSIIVYCQIFLSKLYSRWYHNFIPMEITSSYDLNENYTDLSLYANFKYLNRLNVCWYQNGKFSFYIILITP